MGKKVPAIHIDKKKYLYQKFIRLAFFILLNLAFIGPGLLFRHSVFVLPLLFLPFIAVALSSHMGGIKYGLISVLVSTLAVAYASFSPDFYLSALTAFVFAVGGYIISWIIENLRHSTLISRLEQREQLLINMLSENQKVLKKAEEDVKSRDEFLSIASHELKTPLTSMLLELQFILHNIKNVSLANFSVKNLMIMLEDAEDQTKKLSKMINNLLNVSLIATGKMHLDPEEMNLSKMVSDIVTRSQVNGGKRITREIKPDIKGTWDKLRIEQIVLNLLNNAQKYGKGQPVNVKLYKKDGSARLIVADKGIGIPEDKKDIIFKRFGRAVSDKDYKGLGVGLYIVSQIVQAHNGKIYLESSPGKGSTFTIDLPLSKNR